MHSILGQYIPIKARYIVRVSQLPEQLREALGHPGTPWEALREDIKLSGSHRKCQHITEQPGNVRVLRAVKAHQCFWGSKWFFLMTTAPLPFEQVLEKTIEQAHVGGKDCGAHT